MVSRRWRKGMKEAKKPSEVVLGRQQSPDKNNHAEYKGKS